MLYPVRWYQNDRRFLQSVQPRTGSDDQKIFTEYRKTHNQGVFDVYTPDILRCRKSGVLTGLPDAYGRGRIIGDYRRVALYGIDYLMKDKLAQFTSAG